MFFSLMLSAPSLASLPSWKKESACSRLQTGGPFAEKWFKKQYDVEQRTQILTYCYQKQIEKMKRDAMKNR